MQDVRVSATFLQSQRFQKVIWNSLFHFWPLYFFPIQNSAHAQHCSCTVDLVSAMHGCCPLQVSGPAASVTFYEATVKKALPNQTAQLGLGESEPSLFGSRLCLIYPSCSTSRAVHRCSRGTMSWWRKQRLTSTVRKAAKRKESLNKGRNCFQILSLAQAWEDAGSALLTARLPLRPDVPPLGFMVWLYNLIIVLTCHGGTRDQQTVPNPTGLGCQALAEERDACSRCLICIYTVEVIPTLGATHIGLHMYEMAKYLNGWGTALEHNRRELWHEGKTILVPIMLEKAGNAKGDEVVV